ATVGRGVGVAGRGVVATAVGGSIGIGVGHGGIARVGVVVVRGGVLSVRVGRAHDGGVLGRRSILGGVGRTDDVRPVARSEEKEREKHDRDRSERGERPDPPRAGLVVGLGAPFLLRCRRRRRHGSALAGGLGERAGGGRLAGAFGR